MQNEKFKSAIHKAMERDYRNLTKSSENHMFSPKFEKRMKRLIGRRNKPYYRIINTAAKRAACTAAAVLIVSSATIMSVDALRNAIIDFIVSVYEKFSIIFTEDKKAPETIEEIYNITYDLNDYTIDYHEYNEIFRNTVYVKDDYVIDFSQYTKSAYNLLINTENAETTAIDINGNEAVYFYDNHNYSHIIWDNGDYIIDISSNIDKNALISIAKSVEKVG